MTKKEIRKKYLSLQKQIKKETINKELIDKVLKQIKDVKNVGIYLSINNELDIIEINNYISNTYVPYMKKINNDYIMEFHRLTNTFTKDDLGIISTNGECKSINELDCIFIPGIVYNKKGYRIGYGMGCYDKALMNYHGKKIGVCYDNSLIDEVFDEKHDISVSYILTNKNLYKVGE